MWRRVGEGELVRQEQRRRNIVMMPLGAPQGGSRLNTADHLAQTRPDHRRTHTKKKKKVLLMKVSGIYNNPEARVEISPHPFAMIRCNHD